MCEEILLTFVVAAVEAMISSGVVDPYEFYKYVHLAEVGNSIGSGIGGTYSLQSIFRSRFLDMPVQVDAIQGTKKKIRKKLE